MKFSETTNGYFRIYHHRKVRGWCAISWLTMLRTKLIKWRTNSCYATKSRGRLNPPLRFMYCLREKREESRQRCKFPVDDKPSYSPILSLENHMNFSFGVSVDFLSFCGVKAAEAHCPHHFDLLGRFALEVGFWHMNSIRNFGFWRRW